MDASASSDDDKLPSSYDETPYDSFPFAQSHPARVAAVATLFGMPPGPVERWRILELGCASGGNLLPIAEAFPETRAVGVDLSKRQIADGLELARAAGLRNVELRHGSILDVNRDWGQFDYIICHGVYSWVGADVRERILGICEENLAAQGIAYVSYNTSPGWRMRGMLRDMMCYHGRRFKDPRKRVAQARALLDFLAHAAPDKTSPYSILLTRELEQLQRKSDTYLLHEFLEEHNEPVYFHEFIAHAAEYRLQYLGEVRLASMAATNYPEEVRQTLARLATDIVQQEQYMDFIRNRQFRETLLCRADIRLSRELTPGSLSGLRIAAPLEPPGVCDCGTDDPAEFSLPDGRRLNSPNGVAKAAYLELAACWPHNVSISELAVRAARRVAGGENADSETVARVQLAIAERFLKLAMRSDVPLIETAPVPCVREPGERPSAAPLARQQAMRQSWVASRRHEPVELTDEELFLMARLDGTRDRKSLLERMAERGFHADAGRFELLLRRLARAALLTG
jgi:SAM-dependent methyltransferase